ncbi:MAG TPA: hypothetical protein VGR55_00505 [Candidatus Acidoferrum sp.]|nr:hypothetical protein [Candidatus Acidoferrum sp.]
MVLLALLVSLAGGGLAGGVVSVFYNRSVRRRVLRTDFYPKLNNMFSAYMIRFSETPGGQGRYWVNVVGDLPKGADRDFVERRSDFIGGLIAFNELEEARVLRTAILDNVPKEAKTGSTSKLDLQPELNALETCMRVLHEKLKLDQR